MSYLYTISTVALFIFFILIKKSEKKQNLIIWISLSIMLMMCYNIIIALACFFVKFKYTVQVLIIMNILVSTILAIIILKKKTYQKYFVRKRDLLFCIIALIITLVIQYIRCGWPINIKYYVTDSAVHYKATINSYNNNNSVLNFNKYILGEHGFNNSFMTGHYINCGLFILIFSKICSVDKFYILYIIFETIIFYISFILMYILLLNLKENKISYIISIVLSIIYNLAYPLNSMIAGFQYLSVGLNLILLFFILTIMHSKKIISSTFFAILMSLVSFGIFFSYYLFIPIIYVTFLVNMFIELRKKEVTKIEFLYIVMYDIILPSICGFTYFILYPKLTTNYVPAQSINVYGGIYDKILSNFALFIPIIIYYFSQKNKKIYVLTSLIPNLIFLIGFAIFNYAGYISRYYYIKLYYIMWIPCIIITYEVLNILIAKNKKIFYLIICAIILVIFLNYSVLNNYGKIFDIYEFNFNIIKSLDYSITRDEVDFLEIIKKLDIDKKNVNIYFNQNIVSLKWIGILLDNEIYLMFSEINDIDYWINEMEEEYLIIMKKDVDKEVLDSINKLKCQIIEENDAGLLLKKINN